MQTEDVSTMNALQSSNGSDLNGFRWILSPEQHFVTQRGESEHTMRSRRDEKSTLVSGRFSRLASSEVTLRMANQANAVADGEPSARPAARGASLGVEWGG